MSATKTQKSRRENWQGMNWIRQEKRLALYLRDGLACVYCGSTAEEGTSLSLDHVKPHSKGGDNHETNLVTSCSRCNSARGNRSVRKFAEAVVEYLGRKELTPEMIVRDVNTLRRRPLPMAEAKAIIARRGSVAQFLAAQASK